MNSISIPNRILAAGAVLALVAGPSHAQLAPGLSLNFDANDPTSAIDASNWNSLTADASKDHDFGGDVSLVSVTSSATQVTDAYRFTGGAGDNNNGTWDGNYGDGSAATWEFWIKPSDAGDPAQTILESGGSGTGFAVWYAPGTAADGTGTIALTIDGGSDANSRETVSATIDTSDFRHVTFVYDRDFSGGIDLLEVYVDGALVDDNLSATAGDDGSNDNDNTGLNDFSGGNGSGFGDTNDSLAETVPGNGEFEGDVSVWRLWGGLALSAAAIADNYDVLGGPDTEPPVIAAFNPADEATGTYPAASLVATFSEEIALTGAGTVTVTDSDDGSGSFTINLPDPQITVAGKDLMINPTGGLEFGTNYELSIDGSAVADLADTPNAFAGTSPGDWNFLTAAADGTAPVVAGLSPADEAFDVAPTTALTITFDEDVLLNDGGTMALLDENFESNDGGFTAVNKGTGTAWTHGAPNSADLGGGAVTGGAGGSAQAWGTNLTGGYTAGTDACLRSPVVDLTGLATASLSFARALDAESGHTLEVNIIDDVTDTVIANLIPPTGDADINTTPWETVGPVQLPAVALGQQVRIEWCFIGDGNEDYLGAYIDDVRLEGVDGANAITLKNLTSGMDTTIAVNDSGQVAVNGATVTITPDTPLAGASNFAVQIGSTAIRNYNDLNFAGISDTTTWNFTIASLVVHTASGGAFNNDTWNTPGSWDLNAIPIGSLDVEIGAGNTASVRDATPVTTGNLTLNTDATLYINSDGSNTAWNALGAGLITMNAGSDLILRESNSFTITNDIVLAGDAKIWAGQSTSAHNDDRTFAGAISGPGRLTLQTTNGQTAFFSNTNTWSGGLEAGGALSENKNESITTTATGALGTGDVTINDGVGLQIDAADAIDDAALLTLEGGDGDKAFKLTLNADDTVGQLIVDGFAYPAGTYGAAGNGAVDFAAPWIGGTGILSVASVPADTGLTNPMLVSLNPADDTPDVFVADCIVATFDEPVVAGPGNVLLKNLTDGTTMTLPAAGPDVNVALFTLSIDLAANLEADKDYAIQIEPDAVTDAYGNPFAGMTNDTTWNFSTVGSKVLLSEDFESPDVTAADSDGVTSGAVPDGWIGATRGFGSGRRGIVDEAHGDFTDPSGEQAFAFRYTNSGLTSAEGEIGKLVLGATYTVSFDVVRDDHNSGVRWSSKLVVFEDGAPRNDIRNNNGSTVLKEISNVSENADADETYQKITFTFTPDAIGNAAALGKDLAIRFPGGTTTASIDNVVVSVDSATIPPTVVSIVDDQGGGTVTVPNPVVYTVTFDEAMNPATVGVEDFENGAGAGITVTDVSPIGDPAVFEVTVSTASPGDLILQVKAGAVLEDAIGNPLDTSVAIADDTTLTVDGGGGGTPYANWAAGFAGLTDPTPTADFDGGGMDTGLEWITGGDPTDPADDASLAPTIVVTANDVLFTFRRTDAAAADANTSIAVEYGSNLTGWTTATEGVSGVGVSVVENGAAAGVDLVTASLPRALAVNGKLYVRLSADVVTP